METSLIKLDDFQQALVEAKTIPEVKNLRDQAEIFKQWLKRRHATRLDKNTIAELQIRAERKLGVMLEGDPTICKGSSQMFDNQTFHLPDLGISRFQSHWWQQLANIPDEVFAEYLTEINATLDDDISTLGFIRWNLRKHKPEPSGDWLPLPEGKYHTLVIDPPWPMVKLQLDERTPEINIDFDVKTLEEIAMLDVPSLLAEEGTHTYLWTTQKHLPIALEILEGWGLQYVFTMVWHKTTGSQPFKLPKYNCEFVVFGRTGGLQFLDTKAFFTCFNGKHQAHSQKPKEFYETIARVSPAPRLDMFSREQHKGFEQYGNEPNKFTNRPL